MAKFELRQRVKKIGTTEVRTVEEIREGSGEPMYWIQLGSDFATRIWAKESELEAVPQPSQSEPADGRRRLLGSKAEDDALIADLSRELQDEYARSIGMPGPAFEEVQDCLEHKNTLDYIRRTLRDQYKHPMTNEQWDAAKKWYAEHPRD